MNPSPNHNSSSTQSNAGDATTHVQERPSPLKGYGETNLSPLPHHGTPGDLRAASYRLFRSITGALHKPRPLQLHPTTAADLEAALPDYHATLNGCGIFTVNSGVTVSRSRSGSQLSGVRTCHSRWCPLCAAKIETREAWETRDALLHLHHTGQLKGRSLWHFIPTMRHSRDDDQRANLGTFLEALEALVSSRMWRRYVAGYVLKVELEGNLSRSGLHPHAHVLLIFLDDADVNAFTFAGMLHAAFVRELEARGSSANWGGITQEGTLPWFRPVTDAHDLPRYLAKKGFPQQWNIIHEVTASQAKNGGFWQRRPEDLALCHAYTAGVRLLRAGGIFRTARAHVRKQHETLPDHTTPIITIPAEAWNARPDLHEPIQQLAEDDRYSPAWVAEIVAELFELDPAQAAQWLRDLDSTDLEDEAA